MVGSQAGGAGAELLCAQILMAVGAVWTHSRPSAGMLAAYEADPELAGHRMAFTPTLRKMIDTLVAGALALASTNDFEN
ncbi:hypothetical protein AB0B57_04225 [Micromonospora sp. NPDC049101]|uniref:hypothetical protein n=1 Tax=Micromonospora sp. NPDC049101 TaxID=3155032 RepID=UPI003406C61D